jgi:hypothetical protein
VSGQERIETREGLARRTRLLRRYRRHESVSWLNVAALAVVLGFLAFIRWLNDRQ